MNARLQKFHPSVLLGALWATFAVLLVRRRLKKLGLKTTVPRPPRFDRRAGRGVVVALRRLKPTCLERALVLQAWMASQGVTRDVVIGVPPDGMRNDPAHAWVDGTDVVSPDKYVEFHRLAAPLTPHLRRAESARSAPSLPASGLAAHGSTPGQLDQPVPLTTAPTDC